MAYQSDVAMKDMNGKYAEPAVGIPLGYSGYSTQVVGPCAHSQGIYQQPIMQAPPQHDLGPYAHSQGMYQQPIMQAPPQQAVYYQPVAHPHAAGMIPPTAIYGPPNGVAIHETFYGDTPAPFECTNCGRPGMTDVRSRPSLAAYIACAMTLVGVCFLFKSCDCLWHKQHFCPNCGEKVADFEKSDPCLCVDPVSWEQRSFAVPSPI